MRNQLLILALLATASAPLLACDSAPEPPVAKAAALSPTRLAERPPKAEPATELSAYGVPEHLALKSVIQLNANAHIPPQCYTKTHDDAGKVAQPLLHVPRLVAPPNYIDDGDLQLEYYVGLARAQEPVDEPVHGLAPRHRQGQRRGDHPLRPDQQLLRRRGRDRARAHARCAARATGT